jgi:hypothetical protein
MAQSQYVPMEADRILARPQPHHCDTGRLQDRQPHRRRGGRRRQQLRAHVHRQHQRTSRARNARFNGQTQPPHTGRQLQRSRKRSKCRDGLALKVRIVLSRNQCSPQPSNSSRAVTELTSRDFAPRPDGHQSWWSDGCGVGDPVGGFDLDEHRHRAEARKRSPRVRDSGGHRSCRRIACAERGGRDHRTHPADDSSAHPRARRAATSGSCRPPRTIRGRR